MSKQVILPAIGVILALIAVWAFMTKCGRRKCCKSRGSTLSQGNAKAANNKRSVKSDRSEAPADIESGSNVTHINSDGSSQDRKSRLDSQNCLNRVGKAELSSTERRVRASEPSPSPFAVA